MTTEDPLYHYYKDNIIVSIMPGIGIDDYFLKSFPPVAKQITILTQTICNGENKEIQELNIVITDDIYMQELNARYADLNETTDVLSFDLSDNNCEISGDIYLSLNRALAQSVDKRLLLEQELLNLVAHGVLHLCGKDHNDDDTLAEMVRIADNYLLKIIGKFPPRPERNIFTSVDGH